MRHTLCVVRGRGLVGREAGEALPLFNRPEHQRRVVPTKPKGVAHRRSDSPPTRDVGRIIEIAIRVGKLQVGGRGDHPGG